MRKSPAQNTPRGVSDTDAKRTVATAAARTVKRTRLDPGEREEMILDAAIGFFAENGFNAQLRELAQRIGISQALIFRYFGSKQVLIERVYERVYVARWSLQWKLDLEDRRLLLRDRLTGFYSSYLAAIEGYEWIRMTLYSGLAGNNLTRRYIETRVDGLLQVIAKEIRHEHPTCTLSQEVLHELVWHLHATFIYYLIRKYVFQVPTMADTGTLIETTVTHFLAGLSAGNTPDNERVDRKAITTNFEPSS